MVDQLKLDDLQSYGGLFSPDPLPKPVKEQRQSGRKPLEVDGILVMDGVTYDIETVDISAGGLCIRSAKQLAVGKECHVSFPLTLAGQAHHIATGVQVIYCFYTGEQGFKSGIQFLNISATNGDSIQQFLAA